MSEHEFIASLRQRLTDHLPGRKAQRTAAAELTYGRHRGPAPAFARQAAVVVMLMEDSARDRWTIPLTRRPASIKHHGGQVAFPGGRIESGESSVEAALREFTEELGREPIEPVLVGELTPIYVYASDNLVHPVVVACRRPRLPWRPDPVEVEHIFEIDLRDLPLSWQAERLRRNVHGPAGGDAKLEFAVRVAHYEGQRIWGATAMILAEFAACLSTTSGPPIGNGPVTGG